MPARHKTGCLGMALDGFVRLLTQINHHLICSYLVSVCYPQPGLDLSEPFFDSVAYCEAGIVPLDPLN